MVNIRLARSGSEPESPVLMSTPLKSNISIGSFRAINSLFQLSAMMRAPKIRMPGEDGSVQEQWEELKKHCYCGGVSVPRAGVVYQTYGFFPKCSHEWRGIPFLTRGSKEVLPVLHSYKDDMLTACHLGSDQQMVAHAAFKWACSYARSKMWVVVRGAQQLTSAYQIKADVPFGFFGTGPGSQVTMITQINSHLDAICAATLEATGCYGVDISGIDSLAMTEMFSCATFQEGSFHTNTLVDLSPAYYTNSPMLLGVIKDRVDTKEKSQTFQSFDGVDSTQGVQMVDFVPRDQSWCARVMLTDVCDPLNSMGSRFSTDPRYDEAALACVKAITTIFFGERPNDDLIKQLAQDIGVKANGTI